MGFFDRLFNTEGEEPEDAFDQVMESKMEAVEGKVIDLQLQELGQIEESIKDARADLMMRQTLLEDSAHSGWDLINAQRMGMISGDLSTAKRRERNELAERTWREDPIAGRGVDTMNEYVWGRGLPLPRALDPRVQRVIRSVWEDPENQLILTSYEAQVCKGTELTLFGELFITIFDDGRWDKDDIEIPKDEVDVDGTVTPKDPNAPTMLLPPGDSPEQGAPVGGENEPDDKPAPEPPPPPSAVKLGQIHPNEIADIIPDEQNAARPRFYKRASTVRKYNYDEGTWDNNPMDKKVRYYEDLVFPPQEGQRAPATEKIADGKILHISVNRTSFSLRGNSELWRAVRWAQALNDFFSWRLTMLQANSKFLFKKKVKGGPAAVRQGAQRVAAGMGRTGTPGDYDPLAPPGRGSVLVENQNETMEQFKTTSGAGEAEQDAQMLRGQVGAALGLPIHYLGDKGSANLANATAMEAPVLKMMEARQELFEQAVTKVLNFCIDKAIEDGALPDDVDRTFYVEMPNIMQRSIPELVASLTNTTARLDPFATDVKLKRLTLQQVLTWLGYPDPEAVVRDVYPPGAENQQPVDPAGAMGPEVPPEAAGGAPLGMTPAGPLRPQASPNTNPIPPQPQPEGFAPGATGPFSGSDPRTSSQPYPGARTGVTMNNGQGIGP